MIRHVVTDLAADLVCLLSDLVGVEKHHPRGLQGEIAKLLSFLSLDMLDCFHFSNLQKQALLFLG